ncbi:MAG: 16S rRNA (cytosine(1402)-N(4))-methyltransferase RsmH [candidate division WOR-3 bacterium]
MPCMANEVLNLLNPKKGDIIIDATFGFGGHSLKFLEREKDILIIGIEKDREIFEISKKEFEKYENVKIFNEDFENIDIILRGLNIKEIDKVLFDFGISSYHIEHSKRGFSFKRDEILDLRYDTSKNLPLWKKIKKLNKGEIERILKEFGEEPFYRKIAYYIFKEKEKIKTTSDLNKIIEKTLPYKRWEKTKQRVYQAFRIYINDELEKIKNALFKAYNFLKINGRILCLSYHSLEDRIVKNFFKEMKMKIITKKPLTPSISEIEENPRSRSAKLRCAEKI